MKGIFKEIKEALKPLKGFFITAAIVVVIDAIACVLLWNSDSDILLYILWQSLAVVVIYGKLLLKKLDEDYRNGKGRR